MQNSENGSKIDPEDSNLGNYLFGRHLRYAPINSKLQHPPPPGIPRAFDCASRPGRGEFERCV